MNEEKHRVGKQRYERPSIIERFSFDNISLMAGSPNVNDDPNVTIDDPDPVEGGEIVGEAKPFDFPLDY
ncbi:hypothetical protein HMPREF1870_01708 [Bacteroidales bacterium KA00344]|nr:hypothetical protein HMPREF1870_01708 [Bacteroidales bacterium KA00344]